MSVDINSKYMELVDAVNNSQTDEEHSMRSIYLSAWLDGVGDSGSSVNWLYPDTVQFSRGITDRAMCCGVFLDWKESS